MNQFTDIAASTRGPAGAPVEPIHLGDFTATRRMVYLAIIAIALGVIALHDLLKARARPLEDEQRRERILPFEYLLPP